MRVKIRARVGEREGRVMAKSRESTLSCQAEVARAVPS